MQIKFSGVLWNNFHLQVGAPLPKSSLVRPSTVVRLDLAVFGGHIHLVHQLLLGPVERAGDARRALLPAEQTSLSKGWSQAKAKPPGQVNIFKNYLKYFMP